MTTSIETETMLIEEAVEYLREKGLVARGRQGRVTAVWSDDGGVAHTEIEWMRDNGFEVEAIDFDERKVHFEVEYIPPKIETDQ